METFTVMFKINTWLTYFLPCSRAPATSLYLNINMCLFKALKAHTCCLCGCAAQLEGLKSFMVACMTVLLNYL